MVAGTTPKTWISFSEAQRRASIGRNALLGLIAQGHLSVRAIPGSKPRVRLDDLQTVIDASTKPATARPEAPRCA